MPRGFLVVLVNFACSYCLRKLRQEKLLNAEQEVAGSTPGAGPILKVLK